MNAGPISQKLVFYAFKAVKNNKLGSVKTFRGIKWTLQADFSKGLGMGFFKDVSDGFTKGALQSDKITDPDLQKKDGKSIGALFKTGTGQDEQHAFQ